MISMRRPTIWELLGTLGSILAIVIAIYTPLWQEERSKKKLEVSHFSESNGMSCLSDTGSISVQFDGKREDNLVLHYFYIRNDGGVAVDEGDFYKPLVFSYKGRGSILGVVDPKESALKWSLRGDGSLVFEPFLINPDKSRLVMVAVSSEEGCASQQGSSKDWTFDGEIVNGILIDGANRSPSILEALTGIEVRLLGIFVWMALIVGVSYFYLTSKAFYFLGCERRRWWVFNFAISACSGQNVAALASYGLSDLWGGAWALLLAHSIFLISIYIYIAFELMLRRPRAFF